MTDKPKEEFTWVFDEGEPVEPAADNVEIHPDHIEVLERLDGLGDADLRKVGYRCGARMLPVFYGTYPWIKGDHVPEYAHPQKNGGVVYVLGLWSLFVGHASARGHHAQVYDVAANITLWMTTIFKSVFNARDLNAALRWDDQVYERFLRQIVSVSVLSTKIEHSTQRVVAHYLINNALLASEEVGTSARDACLSEILFDLEQIEQGFDALDLPLWGAGMSPFVPEWEQTRARLMEHPAFYRFWVDWYQGQLDGVAVPYALQVAVAEMDRSVWEGGLSDVSEQINVLSQLFGTRETLH